ncbi:MAG: ASCH domain-containing protein [Pseudomonadota bacterium]
MTATLPEMALSVRQPWAWAIIFAGKDIENRSWQAVNHGLVRRGRIAIHASKGMGKAEYEDARDFINEILAMTPDAGLRCPEAKDLLRGGIIGSVDVTDVVKDSNSHWFMGPRGLVLREPRASEFVPAVGALGYFKWSAADPSIVPAPEKWMLPAEPKSARAAKAAPSSTQGTLL